MAFLAEGLVHGKPTLPDTPLGDRKQWWVCQSLKVLTLRFEGLQGEVLKDSF